MSTNPTLKEILEGELVLHDKVCIVPVNTLPTNLREHLDAEEKDHMISKDLSRETSKIIDEEFAKILSYFKEPQPLLSVIRSYAKENDENAEELLDNLLEPFLTIIQQGFLISTLINDTEEESLPVANNPYFEAYEIIYKVHQTEETELYLAKDKKGNFVALKIGITQKSSQIKNMLKQEAHILKQLSRGIAPTLLKEIYTGHFPYLVLEWIYGYSVVKHASYLRKENNTIELIKLLTNIIKTYTLLHKNGYLHQDIHAGNIMCFEGSHVRLIDFGLAQQIDTPHQIRAGIHTYMAPESLEKKRDINNTASEQYSLMALLFELFTGSSYINFSLRTEKMQKQLIQDKPRSFFDISTKPFPEVEKIFQKSLSKNPHDRFESLDILLIHFESLAKKIPKQKEHTDESYQKKFISNTFKLFSEKSSLFKQGISQGPLSSLFYGEAGIAYTLYRYALIQNSASYLRLSEKWIMKAFLHSTDKNAFYNPLFTGEKNIITSSSTFNHRPGLYGILIFIAFAKGDFIQARTVTIELLKLCNTDKDNQDLTLDTLGIALLLIHILNRDITNALQELHVKIEHIIETIVLNLPVNSKDNSFIQKPSTNLGIAHGVAGQLYVLLKWYEYKKIKPNQTFFIQLNKLIDQTVPYGSGVCIPWRGSTQEQFHTISGWCNGSAGIVMLLCEVIQITNNKNYFPITEKLIQHCWEDQASTPNLCCGLAGRSYALAYYSHLSDKPIWKTRALILTDRAIEASKTINVEEMPIHSLYKGQLGIALMAAEITNQSSYSMPFFGSEY